MLGPVDPAFGAPDLVAGIFQMLASRSILADADVWLFTITLSNVRLGLSAHDFVA